MSENNALVGIVMGSASDWDIMKNCVATLASMGVACETRVLSAHRTPAEAEEFSSTAADRGLKVIIAAAGMAAHLAGAMAAQCILPVIGVPMKGGAVDGLDALLSTVEMPGGIPVATVAIGKAGAVNAGLLACQILATSDPALTEKLKAHRKQQRETVLAADAKVRAESAELQV